MATYFTKAPRRNQFKILRTAIDKTDNHNIIESNLRACHPPNTSAKLLLRIGEQAKARLETALPPGIGKETMSRLVDPHNRPINYLRISITDRCNLRCQYCMPKEGVTQFQHAEILRYEEILRFSRLAIRKGIEKIRLTGGEPLVRKGVVFLIKELSALEGIQDLSMTTNGILLAECAQALSQAGLKRINVSMDSLDPQTYRKITRGGDLKAVWEGLRAAMAAGLFPIKINVVALAGLNDQDVLEFARLTLEYPFQVRFIEFMPTGGGQEWKEESFLSCQEIKRKIEAEYPLLPLENGNHSPNGPARIFRLAGGIGAIGFISPISHHFCDSCNRLRLTADGRLRTCLFADKEIDIKGILRSGCNDTELEKILEEAIRQKPLRRQPFTAHLKRCSRPMIQIGG